MLFYLKNKVYQQRTRNKMNTEMTFRFKEKQILLSKPFKDFKFELDFAQNRRTYIYKLDMFSFISLE